jgi:hypothetical protein
MTWPEALALRIHVQGDRGAVLIADDTGFLKKGTGRRACKGSIPGWLGGRKTARSGCSWPTPGCTGTH